MFGVANVIRYRHFYVSVFGKSMERDFVCELPRIEIPRVGEFNN